MKSKEKIEAMERLRINQQTMLENMITELTLLKLNHRGRMNLCLGYKR